jgi:hypothetical protein
MNSPQITRAIGNSLFHVHHSRENLKVIKKKLEELKDLEFKAKSAAEKLKKAKTQGKPVDILEREGRRLHIYMINS